MRNELFSSTQRMKVLMLLKTREVAVYSEMQDRRDNFNNLPTIWWYYITSAFPECHTNMK